MTGEHLSSDIQELLGLLHARGVRYLIVGDKAVIHHGYPRLTGDVDTFYEQTPSNAKRLYCALQDFGATRFQPWTRRRTCLLPTWSFNSDVHRTE